MMRWGCWALLALTVASCGGPRAPYEGRNVAELERMLADSDPKVQAQGAFGLALKGAQARSAAPALAKALQSQENSVREAAARALGEIDPEAKVAVPALTEALKRPPWSVQRHAAIALGRIGPHAKEALPALQQLSNDVNRPLREAVQEAIKKIHGK